MENDCYVILGVARDANPSQIRRAYRARSRQLHPDRTGTPGEAKFLELKDAYDTLRDAARRADHDRALFARDGRPSRRELDTGGPPLMPAMDLFGSFATHRPSRDHLLRTFLNDYADHLPKSRPVHALNVEVVLSPEQAGMGGVVPFQVPVARPCYRCSGTGQTGLFACDACDGHGAHWSVAQVEVIVPRQAGSGTVIPMSLRHLGVRSMFLNLHLRVAGSWA